MRVTESGHATVLADLIDAVNQTEGDGDQTWTTLSDPSAGRLVGVERDGSLTPILTGLAFPTALLAARNGGLYVTNCGYGCNDRSNFPAALPSLRAGQVLKVELAGTRPGETND